MNRIATPEAKSQAQVQLPVVLMETVRIPPLTDQESFRRWVRSPDFPERGQFSYLNGELWVDLSMEEFFSHNQVKATFDVVIGGLIKAERLGYYCPDGVLLSHPVGLSTEPDLAFVFWETIRQEHARLIEKPKQRYLELEGTPDMVLEIVSPSSVRKDTDVLRDLYWRAGIPEYWLVDARGASLRFDILHRGSNRYVATRKQAGWLRSAVFSRSFRLSQQTDPLGHPEYLLDVQP